MKQELTLEVVNTPGNELLIQVVQTLRGTLLSPECLVWSAIPNTGEARIWVTLSEGETKLHELISDLGRITGVRRVFFHGPGQAIKGAFILPADSG